MGGKERGDEWEGVGGKSGIGEVGCEEVEALEAERPELARCGRGGRKGAEEEASGIAAGAAAFSAP